jgi:hypothetical protein
MDWGGAHDLAERLSDEAMDAARTSGDADLIGSVSGQLGIAASARGDWDSALRRLSPTSRTPNESWPGPCTRCRARALSRLVRRAGLSA